MKLTLFTQHYHPHHFEGGTESVVRAQARELGHLGWEVEILSGTDHPHDGRDVVEEVVDGIPVRFLPRRREEHLDLLLARPRVRALLTELSAKSDVAHVHHWSTLTSTLVRDQAAVRPTLVTLHDLYATCPIYFRLPAPGIEVCGTEADLEPCVRCTATHAPGVPPAELREALGERPRGWEAELAAASYVIAPSRAHAERVRTFIRYPHDALRIVPHGLSDPLPAGAAGREWGGSEALRVLFLGFVSDVKGIGDLVDALAGLDDAERARIELLIAGEVVQPGLEEELRRRGATLEMRFLGAYTLATLADELVAAGGAHLAALPSRASESYGLVLDEAHALGLPVWVSDLGALPERVAGAGRVLPANDREAWRSAFSELLRTPGMLADERAALPSRVRTARDAAGEIDSLYRELLGKPLETKT